MSAFDSPTDLPDPDAVQVSGFWARMRALGHAEPDAPVPAAEYFGDSVELADELLALIIHGPKRATAGAYHDYIREGVPIPTIGTTTIALDGRAVPRALLRTTEVRVGPLSSVDDQFAWDEGEGDRTRETWLRDHEGFFERYLPTVGLEFSPEMPTVFERFDLVAVE